MKNTIMQLIFASNNEGKIREIQRMIDPAITIITLKDAGIVEEIPEPFDTFEENAHAKAKFVYDKTGQNCFAEDSGIIAYALGKDPGVRSARYAGEPKDDHANNQKLLKELSSQSNRKAYYMSVICLMLNGWPKYFSGRCEGEILTLPKGTEGFGYDPIFEPNGSHLSFSEMDLETKNKMSHRAQAMKQLAEFLNEIQL